MRAHHELDRLFAQCEAEGQAVIIHNKTLRDPLLRRVRAGEVVKPVRGLYVRAEWWKSLSYSERGWCVIRALAYEHPDWIFAGTYAAWIWGFTQTYALLRIVERMIARHSNCRNVKGEQAFYSNESDMACCQKVNGIVVSDAYKTVFDCARHLAFGDALAICDAALRSETIRRDDMVSFVLSRRHYRGWKQALRVARLGSPLAKSGGESKARAEVIELGFEVPALQEEFVDPDGVRRRVDFLWRRTDGRIIIGEFDGLQKYLDPELTGGRSPVDVIKAEKSREDDLSLYGVWLFRFGYDDLENPRNLERKLIRFGVPRPHRLHKLCGLQILHSERTSHSLAEQNAR